MRRDALKNLQELMKVCKACDLSDHRTNVVCGEGPIGARLCLVGEAPGATEDRRGRPFVGRSGDLLKAVLSKCDLSREDVFVVNTVACRPPNNRPPKPCEMEVCRSFFLEQIEFANPGIIVAMGATAASAFGLHGSVKNMRKGIRYEAQIRPGLSLPLFVTWHPAYALRNSNAEAQMVEDIIEAYSSK